MRCTAAQYYGADPATGIVEPDSKYTVSGNNYNNSLDHTQYSYSMKMMKIRIAYNFTVYATKST